MNRRAYQLVAIASGTALLLVSLAWSPASENKSREKEQEKPVTLQELPGPVRATIEKEAGRNKIEEIEQVTRGKNRFYEAEWVEGGKSVEIKVASDGKLLGKEVEEDEADEEDEGEEASKSSGESERKVTESEVPAAALAALTKMAAGAKITEFAEEIEHGSTFYEGSWKSPSSGNVDVLVTATGDLVEIEEKVGTDEAPKAVLAAARRAAGKKSKLNVEKKTMILYEVHFRKGEQGVELLLTPDGRCFSEDREGHGEQNERDDD